MGNFEMKNIILGIDNALNKFLSQLKTAENRTIEQTQKDILVNSRKHFKKKYYEYCTNSSKNEEEGTLSIWFYANILP